MEKSIREHAFVAIIAGGNGTRLFPMSHPDCPKQFCHLDDENTFIQATAKRFLFAGFKASNIVVITTNDIQTNHARKQLMPLGVLSQNIYQIKPDYDYAGAMLWAAKFIYEIDHQAVILNTPSDQYIVADDEFKNTIELAMYNAQSKNPTIVGVKVSDIVTVMGCGHAIYESGDNEAELCRVTGFIEKPKREVADKLMRKDNSACNTGINCWRASTIIKRAGEPRKMGTDELMDALGEIYVSVGKFQWYDCGTLKSLWEISKKTPNHKNANLGLDGSNVIDRTGCTGSLFITIPGVDLFVTNIHDAAIVVNEINGKIVIAGVKLKDSQKVRAIADDFVKYNDILTDDFSVGARNNRVMYTNMSELEVIGFVGVDNYAVSAIRYTNGKVVVTVSCDSRV